MDKKTREEIELVEDKFGVTISKTHFVSKEGVSAYNIPTFWVNNGKGDGGHIKVAKQNNQLYIIMPTFKAVRDPVEFFKSGKTPISD